MPLISSAPNAPLRDYVEELRRARERVTRPNAVAWSTVVNDTYLASMVDVLAAVESRPSLCKHRVKQEARSAKRLMASLQARVNKAYRVLDFFADVADEYHDTLAPAVAGFDRAVRTLLEERGAADIELHMLFERACLTGSIASSVNQKLRRTCFGIDWLNPDTAFHALSRIYDAAAPVIGRHHEAVETDARVKEAIDELVKLTHDEKIITAAFMKVALTRPEWQENNH
jgi:hypothetical protein